MMKACHVTFWGVCYFKSDNLPAIIPKQVPLESFYIEALTSGSVIFGAPGEEREYGRGTILWHEGGDWTIGKIGSQGRYSAFVFRGFYDPASVRRPARIGCWRDLQELDHFAATAMRDAFDEEVDHDVLAHYLFMRFYYELYHGGSHENSSAWPVPLGRAVAYLNDAPETGLSVEKLAQHAQVSESHLFWLFRHHLEMSPARYIRLQRLKRAKILLVGSNHPIKEIAEDCGFSSLETFYRVFRQECRMSPAQYRQAHSAMALTDLVRNGIDTLE